MSTWDTNSERPGAAEAQQAPRDTDRTSLTNPDADPAQAEWDATSALDEGVSPSGLGETTRTGRDPAELPADDDEVPREDLPEWADQPETQGESPSVAELGEEGQGDLAPEDL